MLLFSTAGFIAGIAASPECSDTPRAALRRAFKVSKVATAATIVATLATAAVHPVDAQQGQLDFDNSQSTAGDALAVGPDGLMSVSTGGKTTDASGASGASISADGALVAFSSASDSLDRTANGVADVFVRDRTLEATFTASRSFDGDPANGDSVDARISAAGRYVGFTSTATNLVSDNGRDSIDTNDEADAFVYDLESGVTRLLNLDDSGDPHDTPSQLVDLSDERMALVRRTTSDGEALLLVDWRENEVTPIAEADALPAAALSADGRLVVFVMEADDEPELFVFDATIGDATLIDRTAGTELLAEQVVLTGDGNHVLYAARDKPATGISVYMQELGPDATPIGEAEIVSRRTNGDPIRSMLEAPSFSANHDGSTVAFSTNARVIDDVAQRSTSEVYVRRTGPKPITFRASLERHGFEVDGDSVIAPHSRAISDDGLAVTFISTAAMVSSDTNEAADVFVATPAITCADQFVSVFLASGEQPTEGDDVILGTRRGETIDALGGNDVVCGGDGSDFILGGDGNDELHGERGDDVIEGGAGRDKIYGLVGADKLYGDQGNDKLLGGSGDDLLVGNSGKDTLTGGTGDDRISGGKGKDKLNGGAGDDTMSGGGSSDTLNGKSGNDTLSGGDGRDTLKGGTGDDALDGGDDQDTLHGGSGTDDCVQSPRNLKDRDRTTACE